MNTAYFLLKAMESVKKNLKSISKSNYVKDKVLFNFYNDFIEEGGKIENLAKTNVVINTPFLQEKSVTQR